MVAAVVGGYLSQTMSLSQGRGLGDLHVVLQCGCAVIPRAAVTDAGGIDERGHIAFLNILNLCRHYKHRHQPS